MKNSIVELLLSVAGLAISWWFFYKAWWQPNDLVERMMDMYEDPGDLNRWFVKIGVMKWDYRLIGTALFVVMLYVVFRYVAWLIDC